MAGVGRRDRAHGQHSRTRDAAAAAGSIGKTHIVGDLQNSEIKSGYNYASALQKFPMGASINASARGATRPWASWSGHAMLLMNPHLPWTTGWSTYYEIQLKAPGIDLYGASQVGLTAW